MRENVNTTKIKSTLVYQKEMQVQINVQAGEFHRTNKRAVLNKHAGKTSCKKMLMCRTKIDVQ